jgi:O-acetyl-ADP-ribose deacetylase (regulator of RNase III)
MTGCRNDGASRIIHLATMSEPTAPQTDHTLALREEFRHHLETFYAQLKLAPPYESVEKAIRSLTTSVHALPPVERARLATDATARWQHFRQAFESSGLSKKHSGIIAGLARNRSGLNLPAEYDQFLSLYLS